MDQAKKDEALAAMKAGVSSAIPHRPAALTCDVCLLVSVSPSVCASHGCRGVKASAGRCRGAHITRRVSAHVL